MPKAPSKCRDAQDAGSVAMMSQRITSLRGLTGFELMRIILYPSALRAHEKDDIIMHFYMKDLI
jgi:hypothetical protein